MVSANASGEGTNERPRILFFDLLRIVLVALIVYNHSRLPGLESIDSIFFAGGYFLYNIYPVSLGVIAIYGMFFVSGAVLQYNYREIQDFWQYIRFILKRFIRLYPAFWMSLILTLCLVPALMRNGLFSVGMEFTGFYTFMGIGSGIINPMGWFIGAVFCLYLLFPFLARIVEKYGIASLVVLMIVSYVSRVFLFQNFGSIHDLFLWLPICNLFEFCLGIYIVQRGFFPNAETKSHWIRGLAELSFYVFLFHVVAITITNRTLLEILFFRDHLAIIYFSALGITLVVSLIAMGIDQRIQKWLSGLITPPPVKTVRLKKKTV
jgi:peptidoglycan/LPS O-acetylase OafA/YrhL